MATLAETHPPERSWASLGLSVALHVAAFLLITTGPPGVPTGVPGGRVYTLSYLGVLPGEGPGTGIAAAPKRGQESELRRAPQPGPRPMAKPAGRPERPSGQLLTSPKGQESIPVPAKTVETGEGPGVPRPRLPEEPPEAGNGGSGLPGLPAPPKGSGLISALPRLVYPKGAQNVGIKGTVGLKVVVSAEGKPVRVEVERSSGDRGLDEYARGSVERGLVAKAWDTSYALRVEASFQEGIPELKVLDEPVEVGG